MDTSGFRRGLRFTLSLILALSSLATALPPPARAVMQVVWSTADSGAGSLRQAVTDAIPGDTIFFLGALSGQTITLSSTLVITKNLTVDGGGLAIPVTLSGNNAVRVLKVSNNARITLAGLTLTRGRDTGVECSNNSCGGALKVDAGAGVTLTNSTIFSTTAYYGGGIYSAGVLTVLNSTLYSNTAGSWGGGIANSVTGTLFVLNSTLSGNTAPNGGGIHNENALTLLNSTLSGNSSNAGSGGGLRDTGTLTLGNTLIANSTGGDCVKPAGAIVANVRNLVEDGGCSAALSGDPSLGPLALNGGGILTHALPPSSTAIDAGDAATCLAADQRGVIRPQNQFCDIGAYEAPAQAILRMAKTVTPATSVPFHGVVTYTVILSNSGAATDAAVWLTDTLPAPVDFGGWVANPGASVNNDVITWNGSLGSRQTITFTWTATHAGSAYNESVFNTAQASDALLGRSASATFTVTCANRVTVQNTQDSGGGSLRQALIEACADGLVDFAPGLAGQAIVLGSTLSINKNVAIDGRSLATPVTVDGNNAVRILRVTSNISATLAGLTLARGRAQPAGALLVDAGAVVTLTGATVLSNTSTSDGGGIYNYGGLNVQGSTLSGNFSSIDGGGLYNVGRLTVQASSFAGNTANDDGGGLYNRGTLNAQGNTFTRNRSNDDGGGLYVDSGGPAIVTNTTFSANTSGYWGGAVCTNSSGVITLTNSTIAGNAASVAGGGVRNFGRLSIRNTIIANSTAGVDCVNVGTLAGNLNNLVKDGSCGAMFSGDPALGPLANNGGATLTHALWPNSPAIDAGRDGSDICPTTDQRGMTRPQNLHCDIGAYEAPARLPLLTKSVTPDSNVPYHGVVTYTLLLSNRGSENDPDVWVTDTLPAQVDFGGWVQNSGAGVVSDQITWRGAVGTASVFVFVFTATHTGAAFNETVLNTAQVSGTAQASAASATFVVGCTSNASVQNAQDDGAGSLRQVLRELCAGGLIDFDPSLAGQTLSLNSTLVLNKSVTIDGQGLAAPVTLSGNGAVRILKVTNNARVTLAGLTLARGNDTSSECNDGLFSRSCGGALKVDAGAVVTVTHSTVQTSTAYFGGGLSNFGTLLIQASTIAGNVGGWDGGGLYSKGTLTVQNSTVSGNTANFGGGICGVDGVTTLQNSTLAGNTAQGGGGGGLRQYGGTLHYSSTLMAGNFTGGDCYVSSSNVISTNVNNLVRDGSCSATLSGDPVLGMLADNGPAAGSGRATWTHALLAGSAAIDAGGDGGGDSCPATDQRGVARPIGPRCDIGAYEAPLQLPALAKSVTPTSSVPYHGVVTYTLQLRNGGSQLDPNVWVTDTLPALVDFGGWVQNPGASVADDQITWHGAVDPSAQHLFIFTATHTGGYNETVVNTALVSGAAQASSAAASFSVQCSAQVTVQNTQDSGAGSLRQALFEVCAQGLIDFAPGLAGQTVSLGSSLVMNKDLTLDGRALAAPVTLNGGGAVRVMQVTNSARVTLAGLTIARGTAPGTENGGGLKVDAGSIVTLTNSTIFNSAAYYGGGIFSAGVVTVLNSTLYSNTAGWAGGGMSVQGVGTLFVQNSTLSGNSAPYGGGVVNEAMLTLLNSTLTNNVSNLGNGGGLRSAGTLSLRNTLIANSGTSVDCVKIGGTVVTNTYSLIEDGSASCSTGALGLLTGDPLLGPLADNGGRTLTHAPLPGSPVVDAVGDTSCPATDQRGVARPQGARCDIGAVEGRPETSLSKSVTPTRDLLFHGLVTYTVVLANAGPLTDTTVLFSDTLPTQVIFGQWVEKPVAAALVNGNRLTWSGRLVAGEVITIAWTALHIGGYGDAVINTASMSGTVRAGTAMATFVVEQPVTMLSATYTVNTTTVRLGDTLTYTLRVTNTGDAGNVQMTATVPGGSLFVGVEGGTTQTLRASQPSSPQAPEAIGYVVWSGVLGTGESHTLAFWTQVVSAGVMLSSTATVGGDGAPLNVVFDAPVAVQWVTYLPAVQR